MKCPHCLKEAPVAMVAKHAAESRIAIRMVPAPGELMQITTVGGTLTQMQKLLEACGRQLKHPTVVLLEDVARDDEGGFTFTMMVARGEEAVRVKARKHGRQPRRMVEGDL